MRVIETKVYTINEHPNPEKCYEWIKNNWYHLGDFTPEEVVQSLRVFADCIGASVDWCLSITPDRGEYISFSFGYEEKNLQEVLNNLDLSGHCPLTGVCYDEVILDAFREPVSNKLSDVLSDVEYRVLKYLHSERDYVYSDDGLQALCEANDYEFDEGGNLV